MNDHFRILKYLFEKDNGEFLDVTMAFKDNKCPKRARIEQIYQDLDEYIETESIYNYRGIITLNDKEIPKTPLLKARIKQKGRDYYIEQKNKNISITISKRNLWIGSVLLIIAILTFYFTIINPLNLNPTEKKINETNFPSPVVCLENKTNDTIFFYARQDFILWLPETVYGDAPNVTGKYEFMIDTSKIINGLPYILPNSKQKLVINIENKKKFYNYFVQNENELMLWLRTKPYNLYSSTNLPFNKKYMTQYCLELVIEDK